MQSILVAASPGGIIFQEFPSVSNATTEVKSKEVFNKVARMHGMKLRPIILTTVVTVGIGMSVYFLFIKKRTLKTIFPEGRVR